MNQVLSKFILISFTSLALFSCQSKEKAIKTRASEIGLGWSQTSVNTPIFRKNSIVSSSNYQFVAYYDSTATVVLAKRRTGTDRWEIRPTQYKGNVSDAHNVISIMADGDGFLHISWDHHNNPLHYAKSIAPESLEMGEMQPMVGEKENAVSYPEFYRFDNGDLLFAYRDGGSGNGNLMLNRYHLKTKSWSRLQTNLIDGEGLRNAYWQIFIDGQSTIHISWVWRETPDVASNHDMCYACSKDGSITWENSKGETYNLPINAKNAEVVQVIPQHSNLINQTSMVADKEGNPYIATYYKMKQDSCTQFYIIYKEKGVWKTTAATNKTLDFDLGGMGSRSVPISRPQLLINDTGKAKSLFLVYRDEEFGNKVCLATTKLGDTMVWTHHLLTTESVGRWEPSYDTELWRSQKQLHLFLQNVGQGQGETSVQIAPQPVKVLEVNLP